MTTLIDQWRQACRGAGATADDPAIDAAGDELLRRWAEPHRHYHDRAHLTDVLTVLDELGSDDLVRLAAWWHDAVYDPRATGHANERDSAALAERVLSALGVPSAATAEVVRLVLLTAGHTTNPGDHRGELLCDADLAVLARPPREYDRYVAAVRREYRHLPDEVFRAGRAAALRQLTALPVLYRRPDLVPGWEARARANLRRELAALTVT
ncbi:MAG TPA: metal-dependent phosphohydrolase [Catenuloplanes sp.]|jgi:predicted metal-dependent HD superfamily phosphohydrolase